MRGGTVLCALRVGSSARASAYNAGAVRIHLDLLGHHMGPLEPLDLDLGFWRRHRLDLGFWRRHRLDLGLSLDHHFELGLRLLRVGLHRLYLGLGLDHHYFELGLRLIGVGFHLRVEIG